MSPPARNLSHKRFQSLLARERDLIDTSMAVRVTFKVILKAEVGIDSTNHCA